MRRVRIKICCIANIEEAQTAINYGADAIGLVGKMPSGPGPIQDELIAQISLAVPPPVATFLLTSEQSAKKVIEHMERTRTNTVQMVDELPIGAYREIKSALPNVKLVQVIHVVDETSIHQALRVEGDVDAILLDSGNPRAAIKTLGGTGKTHDWNISKRLVEAVKVPVILAGGLTSENVEEAVSKVKPYAVDVCSGVRTQGKLDKNKLQSFVTAVYEAGTSLS